MEPPLDYIWYAGAVGYPRNSGFQSSPSNFEYFSEGKFYNLLKLNVQFLPGLDVSTSLGTHRDLPLSISLVKPLGNVSSSFLS